MMNDFILNPEFWVAILFAIGFSLILAVVCQSVYDTYMGFEDVEDSDDVYITSEDSIVYGDTVYDSVDKCTGIVVGTCLGEDNDEYFVVIRAVGTGIYVYKSIPSALTKITEQE